ncbi:hypothetical protein FACS1894171_0910 [Clostridia bacterium]|nr:hypothetical protein FACS1894171_0910 [Clostridia bacterium]
MREFIAKRLAEMKNPEERVLLRELMENIFLPMYDETERKYAALERRVHDELPLVHDAYTVYSTVLPRTDARGHLYLNPIIPEETNSNVINAKYLAAALGKGEHPVIETVFFEADYLACRRLACDKMVFNGVFVTATERYTFRCRLEPVKRYADRVITLYNAFARNNVPWTTVNSAYLNKFFDVSLVSMDDIPEGAVIQNAEIDFGSYNGDIRRGVIPVWNIDVHQVKSKTFPEPALDNINFEYQFDLNSLGADNGFLIDYDNVYILSVRREENSITIVSAQSKGIEWRLYRFRRKNDTSMDRYAYPVLSNARKDSFSDRLILKYGTHINTPAEARKLLTSFETSEYLEALDFHFAGDRLSGDTYDMNPFLLDELRDPDYKKTLVLSFKAKKRDFFLNRDILSFLVSEFQAAYPEYRCVGVLV